MNIKAADQDVRFILLSAKPLKEPIAWGSPIVINTKEELNSTFKELDNDTFIKGDEINGRQTDQDRRIHRQSEDEFI